MCILNKKIVQVEIFTLQSGKKGEKMQGNARVLRKNSHESVFCGSWTLLCNNRQ